MEKCPEKNLVFSRRLQGDITSQARQAQYPVLVNITQHGPRSGSSSTYCSGVCDSYMFQLSKTHISAEIKSSKCNNHFLEQSFKSFFHIMNVTDRIFYPEKTFKWFSRAKNVPVPVAEWLRRWANLGLMTTTELLGGRGFESHSRHEQVRVFHPGKKFQWFSLTENVSYLFLHPT